MVHEASIIELSLSIQVEVSASYNVYLSSEFSVTKALATDIVLPETYYIGPNSTPGKIRVDLGTAFQGVNVSKGEFYVYLKRVDGASSNYTMLVSSATVYSAGFESIGAPGLLRFTR